VIQKANEWLAKGAGGKSGAGFFDKLGLGN